MTTTITTATLGALKLSDLLTGAVLRDSSLSQGRLGNCHMGRLDDGRLWVESATVTTSMPVCINEVSLLAGAGERTETMSYDGDCEGERPLEHQSNGVLSVSYLLLSGSGVITTDDGGLEKRWAFDATAGTFTLLGEHWYGGGEDCLAWTDAEGVEIHPSLYAELGLGGGWDITYDTQTGVWGVDERELCAAVVETPGSCRVWWWVGDCLWTSNLSSGKERGVYTRSPQCLLWAELRPAFGEALWARIQANPQLVPMLGITDNGATMGEDSRHWHTIGLFDLTQAGKSISCFGFTATEEVTEQHRVSEACQAAIAGVLGERVGYRWTFGVCAKALDADFHDKGTHLLLSGVFKGKVADHIHYTPWMRYVDGEDEARYHYHLDESGVVLDSGAMHQALKLMAQLVSACLPEVVREWAVEDCIPAGSGVCHTLSYEIDEDTTDQWNYGYSWMKLNIATCTADTEWCEPHTSMYWESSDDDIMFHGYLSRVMTDTELDTLKAEFGRIEYMSVAELQAIAVKHGFDISR